MNIKQIGYYKHSTVTANAISTMTKCRDHIRHKYYICILNDWTETEIYLHELTHRFN